MYVARAKWHEDTKKVRISLPFRISWLSLKGGKLKHVERWPNWVSKCQLNWSTIFVVFSCDFSKNIVKLTSTTYTYRKQQRKTPVGFFKFVCTWSVTCIFHLVFKPKSLQGTLALFIWESYVVTRYEYRIFSWQNAMRLKKEIQDVWYKPRRLPLRRFVFHDRNLLCCFYGEIAQQFAEAKTNRFLFISLRRCFCCMCFLMFS